MSGNVNAILNRQMGEYERTRPSLLQPLKNFLRSDMSMAPAMIGTLLGGLYATRALPIMKMEGIISQAEFLSSFQTAAVATLVGGAVALVGTQMARSYVGRRPDHETLIDAFDNAQMREGPMNVSTKTLREVAEMSPLKRLLTVPASVRKAAAVYDELRREDPKALERVNFDYFDKRSQQHAQRVADGHAQTLTERKGLSL